jgi:hypothetical protein
VGELPLPARKLEPARSRIRLLKVTGRRLLRRLVQGWRLWQPLASIFLPARENSRRVSVTFGLGQPVLLSQAGDLEMDGRMDEHVDTPSLLRTLLALGHRRVGVHPHVAVALASGMRGDPPAEARTDGGRRAYPRPCLAWTQRP